MDIKDVTFNMPNRAKAVALAEYIGDDVDKFDELMTLVFENPGQVMVRTSWVMNFVLEQHHHMLEPYWPRIIKYLQTDVHNAFGRNIFRILGFIPLPEKHLGELASLAFDYVSDTTVEVAIRSNSIVFLMNVIKAEPELATELKMILEDHLEYEEKMAFRVRAKRALKLIAKMGQSRPS